MDQAQARGAARRRASPAPAAAAGRGRQTAGGRAGRRGRRCRSAQRRGNRPGRRRAPASTVGGAAAGRGPACRRQLRPVGPQRPADPRRAAGGRPAGRADRPGGGRSRALGARGGRTRSGWCRPAIPSRCSPRPTSPQRRSRPARRTTTSLPQRRVWASTSSPTTRPDSRAMPRRDIQPGGLGGTLDCWRHPARPTGVVRPGRNATPVARGEEEVGHGRRSTRREGRQDQRWEPGAARPGAGRAS